MRSFYFLSLISVFTSVTAFAEVENEKFDMSSYLLEKIGREAFHFISFGENAPKVRKRPHFENPFKGLSLEAIKAQVKVIPSTRPMGEMSQDIIPKVAAVPLETENMIEIYLPENRCQTGWIKWGSKEEGYSKCPVLGRGDSVLGSLEFVAGLQMKVPDFKDWIISENSGGFTEKNTKPNSRFEGENDYSYCLSRPETQTNGMTVVFKPDSTIGTYLIQTGFKVHSGKEEWGTVPGSKRNNLPLKMVKILDPRNNRYSNEGRLIYRDDFWVHSYEDKRDSWPLEALSTWGCPRLPRRCQAAIQKWAAQKINEGAELHLKVQEQDARAQNFERE